MSVSHFDVLREMSKRDLDIRVGSDFVRSQLVKRGTEVTMGFDSQLSLDLAAGKPLALVLLVYDTGQFREIKKELENDIT